ncbi:hypothetical protein Nepgr_024753 [Nepenthes gracilis]|uniref:Uncharacterized protein n=1 Tax=Nepenthes gracilis TaxID=150966 RepID=A0AAD3T3U7_NEPGR|nr:hypothetical protein Nepgr_024753 [Nepenthes gracilis]
MKLEFPSMQLLWSVGDCRFHWIVWGRSEALFYLAADGNLIRWLRDDANRLNAGSILFEALILFRLADGKQLTAYYSCYCKFTCRAILLSGSCFAFGSLSCSGGVGFGPMLQGALFLVLMPLAGLAGAGGDVITHDASLWIWCWNGDHELDDLDVNACYPGSLCLECLSSHHESLELAAVAGEERILMLSVFILCCNSVSYWEFLCPDWIGDFAYYFTHDAAALFDLVVLWRDCWLKASVGWRLWKMVVVLGLAGMGCTAVPLLEASADVSSLLLLNSGSWWWSGAVKFWSGL